MMKQWGAYCRLLRLDKPIGILLLWFPTAWALWLARHAAPNFKTALLFFIGTVVMRSAGCVINDIADRHIDKHVARTKLRPLTAGEVSLKEAFIVLGGALFIALAILLQLPSACFIWAITALVITFIYPFCKRFISAPQMVLGFAFSMGIPMAYAALGVGLNQDVLILLLINCSWIVAYDTMYAMSDKEDDLKIGVHSTAIYFGCYDRLIIGILLLISHSLWLYLGLMKYCSAGFFIPWILAALVLCYQQYLIHKRIPQQCFKSFLTSAYYGGLMWFALGAVG